MLDTLTIARRLTEAGREPTQANAITDAIIGRLLTLNRQLDLEMRKQLDRQKPES